MLILIATIVETWLYFVVAAIIAIIIITSPRRNYVKERSPPAITRYWSLHRGKRRSLNPNTKKKVRTCAATTKTGCTCKLNYSREPSSTWGGGPSTGMRNASRLLVKLVIKPY